MTSPVNPALASMQDIQTPTEIGLWPVAYGYWISLFIIVLTITLVIFWLRKRRKMGAAKRAALKELTQLDSSHTQFATEVSSILKRAAMSYAPRQQIAQLSGDNWYKWLNAQVKTPQDELCKLLAMRFQKAALSEDEKQMLRLHAQSWLKAALPLGKMNASNHKGCEVSQC